MLSVDLAGHRLVLLPQRAAWLPDAAMLLVADVHLGKAAAFRQLGVPVPEATTDGTLQRLDAAIALTAATTLVFLGDLLHSAAAGCAATSTAVERWRGRHPSLDLLLVRGNHDRRAGDPPAAWRVRCVDEPLRLGSLALKHHPEPEPGAYVVAGHVHPGIVIGGAAHDRIRLPCFHVGERLTLLPAFGEFTGLRTVPCGARERAFVVAAGRVREWRAPAQ